MIQEARQPGPESDQETLVQAKDKEIQDLKEQIARIRQEQAAMLERNQNKITAINTQKPAALGLI